MSTRAVVFPTCTSCSRPVAPDEKAVNFPCPNCNKITIWRCELCRELGKLYICPSCGFEGP